MKSLTFAILFVFPLAGVSAEIGCQDWHAYACSAAKKDDGTGRILEKEEAVGRVRRVREDVTRMLSQLSREALSGTGGDELKTYFRKELGIQEERRAGYVNANWSSCEASRPGHGNQHTERSRRVNALFSVNPKMRKQVDCQNPNPKFTYCKAEGSSSGSSPVKVGVR